MSSGKKTALVTGASRGIGAGVVEAFLQRGYSVVANALEITQSNPFAASADLALVDGDIGDPQTAANIADTAISRFGRIDALVNNAGIYLSKPFTDYTVGDLRALFSVNIEGFFLVTQRVIRQMLAQKTGGSIVNISTTMVDHPFAGVPASVSMITKGGLQTATRSLALEYAKDGIRVNAVAPGIVDTSMHENASMDALRKLQPMGKYSSIKDIVDAILYLTEAGQVTGEVLHVDGGAHIGQW
jgi:NAD(P)-dependent dehydrogenase (short-subunit alcohol dehydrogenase family)